MSQARAEAVSERAGRAWRIDPPPNIFAIVMSTGIVSMAAHNAGLEAVALGMLWLNAVVYVMLWLLFSARMAQSFAEVRADFHNHARGPGFFTMVAGTSVLGRQAILILGSVGLGKALWFVALGLWFPITYLMFPGLMEGEKKPSLAKGLNGGWLLTVVATQSLCVLGCRIAGEFPNEREQGIVFAALGFWLVGAMIYIWMIAIIFYRWMFLPMNPGDLTPAYWINMGAMAISTLAGVSLTRDAAHLPLLVEILPFVKGLTLMFWATATWWIPMLLVAGVWRHLQRRYPLRYEHGYWSVVFPLGMYTVCTQGVQSAFDLPFLSVIPAVFVWVALGAWCLAALGLAVHLFKKLANPAARL